MSTDTVFDEILSAFEYAANIIKPPANNWEPLAHQIPPEWAWAGWLLLGGRGAGKTATCAKFVHDHVMGPPCLPQVPGGHWISIVAPTLGDAVTSCVSGPSGLIAHDRGVKVLNRPGGIIARWSNGCEAKLFGAHTPEDVERFRAGGNRCFTAGMRMLTNRGWVRMDEVSVADRAWTPAGWTSLDRAGLVAENAEVWDLELSDGRVITATPDHKFWTEAGQVELRHLVPGTKLEACSLEMESLLSTTEFGGKSRRTDTTPTSIGARSTPTSGNKPTDRYQPVASSITSTKIPGTTIWTTSSASPGVSISSVTPETRRSTRRVARRPSLRHRQGGISASIVELSSKRNERLSRVVAAAMTPVVRAVRPSGSAAVYCVRAPGVNEIYVEGVRSHNCLVWMEELAAWRYLQEAFEQIRYGLRSGPNPIWVGSTTPKNRHTIKEMVHDETIAKTGATTRDNPYLNERVRDALYKDYEGTRMGRQELAGELLEDVEGALWNSEILEQQRLDTALEPEWYDRVVVAIDPAASNTERSDETGIIVAGRVNQYYPVGHVIKRALEPHGFILDDQSGKYSPTDWARKAIRLYKQYEADLIIAEKNNGGDMVKTVIHSVDPDVPVHLVNASRGKAKRAEPISALYYEGRVWHLRKGTKFDKLEDQMTTWEPMDPDSFDGSPDRMDALVWALTDLLDPQGNMRQRTMQDDRMKGRR